jgi:hypothetical protein
MQIKVEQPPAAQETYEIDGETRTSEFLSTIAGQPGFGNTFTMAAEGKVMISFDGDHAQDALEAMTEAALYGETIAIAFGDAAVRILLPPKVANKDQIKLVTANGEALAALVVPSPPSFKDVVDALKILFEGADLTLSDICAPAKNSTIARFKLQMFDQSSDVIEGVAAKVSVTSYLLRQGLGKG